MPAPILGIVKLATDLIGRKISSKAEQKKAVKEIEMLAQKGEIAKINAIVETMQGQIDINIQEAKHKSIFVAGWRPFIGWVGGAALAYQFLFYPLFIWLWAVAKAIGWVDPDLPPPPVLDTGPLFAVVAGMLGVAGMRSFDKLKGTQTDKI